MFSGYGQEFGGIAVHLTNRHRTLPLRIHYFELVPWYLRIYLHTLTLSVNQQEQDPLKGVYDGNVYVCMICMCMCVEVCAIGCACAFGGLCERHVMGCRVM